jgi:peptidoglycan hydrolase-like protein with peptidoglycan-binding domain
MRRKRRRRGEHLNLLGKRIFRSLIRPAALARTALLALGAGIVGNALFLQSGPHPAPLFAASDPTARVLPPAPDALVIAVQSELQAAGYYDGPVDGLVGPRTEAAIATFQRAAGVEATGEVRPELLEMIAGASEPQGDAPASVEGGNPVAVVQKALSRAAYGPLPVDGLLGPRTRDAIKQFEADHGLPVSGEISEQLMTELHAVGALQTE